MIRILVCLLVVGIFGCHKRSEQFAARPAPTLVAPESAPVVGTPAERNTMVSSTATTYEDALEKARQLGKPIIARVHATWCQPCRRMQANVWSDPEVSRIIDEKFINLDVDADRNRDVVSKLRVTALPTYVIFNSQGQEKIRQVGGESKASVMDKLKAQY